MIQGRTPPALRAWIASCEEWGLPAKPREYFTDTRIPRDGWLDACRICGCWTPESKTLASRRCEIPMCVGCSERLVAGKLFDLYPIRPEILPPLRLCSPVAGLPGGPPPLSMWSTPTGRTWVSDEEAKSGGPFQTASFLQKRLHETGGDMELSLYLLHVRVNQALGRI